MAGDRRIEELYLSYHRRLARFSSRFTSRTKMSKKSSTIRSWCGQSAKDFRNASQVSTWVIGIAYRTALKSLRKQKNHSAVANMDDYPDQAVDPSADTEVSDWLTQGMNRLSVEQRLTLELAYNMGHSLEEIAAITECPVGTVKARMFHAREKLRQYLPQLGGESAAENFP